MAGADFEIHVNRGGQWKIEGAHAAQPDALSIARRLLSGNGVEAVKVIQNSLNRFGKAAQTTVFEQQRQGQDSGIVAIQDIDEAPSRCQKANDLFGNSARQVMGKLLRNYTAKMNITVGEILYNGRELKRVMERDNILNSAVTRVATLQSAENRQNTNARRDELFGMLNEVLAKANAAEKTALPSISAVGFTALEQAVATKATDPENRDYLLRVAISRDLMNERSFLGKIGNALDWVDGADPSTQVAALDDFIADALVDPAVIRDLLGRRDSLLAAIMALFDLLDGKMTVTGPGDTAGVDSVKIAERLNALTATARLPGATAMIADHLQSMLAGKNALIREGTPAQEAAALNTLINRIVPVDGSAILLPRMLLSLIDRCARVLDKGGESGRKAALEHLCSKLTEPTRRFRFLFAVHAATPGSALAAHAGELIQRWISETTSANVFHQDVNPSLVIRAATQFFYFCRDSGFPEEFTRPLIAHVEKLLFEYVEKSQIFKFVDNPTQPLRVRARLLMSMCLPEMLPPGKVAEAARARVVNHLRQPNFMTEVVADLKDQTEKEQALRELFDLMKRAGFM